MKRAIIYIFIVCVMILTLCACQSASQVHDTSDTSVSTTGSVNSTSSTRTTNHTIPSSPPNNHYDKKELQYDFSAKKGQLSCWNYIDYFEAWYEFPPSEDVVFVPDETTALKIAWAVMEALYPTKHMQYHPSGMEYNPVYDTYTVIFSEEHDPDVIVFGGNICVTLERKTGKILNVYIDE